MPALLHPQLLMFMYIACWYQLGLAWMLFWKPMVHRLTVLSSHRHHRHLSDLDTVYVSDVGNLTCSSKSGGRATELDQQASFQQGATGISAYLLTCTGAPLRDADQLIYMYNYLLMCQLVWYDLIPDEFPPCDSRCDPRCRSREF
jgi:hypothetical protein